MKVVSDSLLPHGGLYSPWNSPGQNTGVGSLSLLQEVFQTQGFNPGFPHCRQILYQLGHEGSPRILEWAAYPFSRGSSQPRDGTGVSHIAGGFFTNWATREADGGGENQFDVGRVSLKVFMGHSAASVSLMIGCDGWTLEWDRKREFHKCINHLLIENQWHVNSGKLMMGMKPGYSDGEKSRISRCWRGGKRQERASVARKARENLYFPLLSQQTVF